MWSIPRGTLHSVQVNYGVLPVFYCPQTGTYNFYQKRLTVAADQNFWSEAVKKPWNLNFTEKYCDRHDLVFPDEPSWMNLPSARRKNTFFSLISHFSHLFTPFTWLSTYFLTSMSLSVGNPSCLAGGKNKLIALLLMLTQMTHITTTFTTLVIPGHHPKPGSHPPSHSQPGPQTPTLPPRP